MDAGRGGPAFRLLGRAQRPPQPRQAAGAEEGGEEQAVGPQRPADLDQRAGQVVDRVERAGRDDQVEATRRAKGRRSSSPSEPVTSQAALAQPFAPR